LAQLFHIKTFGCQMNKHDSDSISKILLDKGYSQADSIEDAHIILINTCAVREKAEEKALTLIGRLARLKMKRPEMIAGVIGCSSRKGDESL